MNPTVAFQIERRARGESRWSFYAAPKDATEKQARECAAAWNALFTEWRFRAVKVTEIREVLKEPVQP